MQTPPSRLWLRVTKSDGVTGILNKSPTPTVYWASSASNDKKSTFRSGFSLRAAKASASPFGSLASTTYPINTSRLKD